MLSIPEFCKLAGISRSLFYRLRERGTGPAETRIGSRILINPETARAWLKAQEKPKQAA